MTMKHAERARELAEKIMVWIARSLNPEREVPTFEEIQAEANAQITIAHAQGFAEAREMARKRFIEKSDQCLKEAKQYQAEKDEGSQADAMLQALIWREAAHIEIRALQPAATGGEGEGS